MDRQEALSRASLFSRLAPAYLAGLASRTVERRFKAGEVILREGEPGIALFVITEGKVQVVRHAGQANELVLGEEGPGSFFGEMTLIDEAPRSATVRALSDTICVALPRVEFRAAVREQPDIAMAMLREMSLRLRECNDRAGTPVRD